MDYHLLRTVFLLVLSISCTMVSAQVKSFPKMNEMHVGFYQLEAVLSDEDRDFSALATEYYDDSQGISVLKVLAVGDKMAYYYYNYTNDILEVNGTACTASPVDESVEFYDPPFYGWVNRNPFVIGPSALLWFAQDKKADYMGTKVVRGIRCDWFQIDIDAKDDKIDFKYYFAADDWTTPYKATYKDKNLKVPIRIELNGVSARTTMGHLFEDENQVIDFSYFKTTISDKRDLQPPYGIGCFGRKGDKIMPKLPDAFKYSVQIHDMLKATEPDAISYERVYFDNRTLMARVDEWSRTKRASTVYDFQNGVSYNIETNYQCEIKAIRKSMFVRDDGHMLTFVKSPQQILGLTGDFYFMGYTRYRGIHCSVFETAKRFAMYQGNIFYLLVVTVFFTQDYTEVITNGEDLMEVPVYLRVTGYNAFNNMTFQRQFNIFGFDDVAGETMYQNFQIESCFPRLEDRAYFVLIIKPPKDDKKFKDEMAKPLERNNYNFLQGVRSELASNLNISDIRIPFLKADYYDSGIYVTGLMLQRPPFLSQFWLYPLSRVPLGRGLKLRENANTLEDCARTCIEDTFLCRGFHFCGQTCLTASVAMDNDTVRDKEIHNCKVYFRGYGRSNNKQPFLADAVSLLEQAVDNRKFSVAVVPIDPADNNDEIIAVFNDIVFGEGPFVKTNSDKSYKMVAENYQLISQTYVETTLDEAGYDTITDCHQACKDEKSLACASFSICPNAKVKSCRISSQVVINPDSAVDDIEETKGCSVYSILFLEMFDKKEGLMPMIPGGKSYKNIRTPEECAQRCKQYEGFSCRGFEHCNSKKSCVLHHRHALDLTKEEIGVGDADCSHYSSKFVTDYTDMGNLKINDGIFKQNLGVTPEECAKACSEQLKTCKSFNFCPPSMVGASDSSCTLSTKSPLDKGIDPVAVENCHLFLKKSDVEIEGWDKFKLEVTDGKKGGGSNMAGLVIGTLVAGLLIGVAIAFGYSYYRSRKGGDGMNVHFVKS